MPDPEITRRARLYRAMIAGPGYTAAGSFLIAANSVEHACSLAGRSAPPNSVIHSVVPVFSCDAEEHDFFHFFVKGHSATEQDVLTAMERISQAKVG